MPDSTTVITAIVNGGVAVGVLLAFFAEWIIPRPTYLRLLKTIARKDAEIEKLQEALALERQRSNDATQAGAVTNQLISGLVRLASSDHHAEHDGTKSLPAGGSLDLTAKDLGL